MATIPDWLTFPRSGRLKGVCLAFPRLSRDGWGPDAFRGEESRKTSMPGNSLGPGQSRKKGKGVLGKGGKGGRAWRIGLKRVLNRIRGLELGLKERLTGRGRRERERGNATDRMMN